MKFKITTLFFVLISWINSSLLAQVTPDFTSDFTEGCVPLVVNFNDLSTGNVQTVAWDFGNGSSSSTLSNNPTPQAVYTTAGTYEVKLIANEGLADADSIIKVAYITVFENPTAIFFSTDTNGCAPFTTTFSNNSTFATGTNMSSFSWTFDDGTVPNTTIGNPTHTYVNPNIYNVILQVVDNNGCKDDTVLTYSVSTPPVIDFSGTPLVACTAPLDVTFTNNSTSGLNYTWDFGNGTTSTLENPTTVAYNQLGLYNVALTVSDPAGCVAIKTNNNYVQITDVVANISATVGCVNKGLNFTNNTVGANQYSWNFGDGFFSSSFSPTHAYASEGNYTVTLVATNSSAGCSDTTTIAVTIVDFTADFTMDATYQCATSGIINFTDNSGTATATAWQWTMGNGDTLTVQNPAYSFGASGAYDVKLNVTSTDGCVATKVLLNAVTVSVPNANFTFDYTMSTVYPNTIQMCEGDAITITDNSIPDVNGTLQTWNWDFGDGHTVTNNTSASEIHTYATDGDYVVLLTVTNTAGCSDIDSVNVKVGKQLNPTMVITTVPGDSTSCAKDDINFLGNSDDNSLPETTEWIWQGENGFGGAGQSYDFQYSLVSALGWNLCSLIVDYNGCKDTIIDSVFIVGPIIEDITVIQNCNNPDSVQFIPNMGYLGSDTVSYTWSWDDAFPDLVYTSGAASSPNIPNGTDGGKTFGTYLEPTHIYDGTSTVRSITLTAVGDSVPTSYDAQQCEYEFSVGVTIAHIQAQMTYKDSVCLGEVVTFNGVTSVDAQSWSWNFGNGKTGGGTSDTSSFIASGTYPIELTVVDGIGCTRSVVDSIYVFAPIADFTPSTVLGCAPLSVTFTDVSVPSSAAYPITNWDWDLASSTDTSQNTANSYENAGVQTITLTITDALGCINSVSKTIEAKNPTANFNVSDATLCANTLTDFTSTSTPYSGTTLTSYEWTFTGSITTSITGANPQAAYANGGTYDVELVVTDNIGCTDTMLKPNYIDVQDIPTVNFTADQTTYTCYPAGATFTADSVANVVTYVWHDGTGTITSINVGTDVFYNLYTELGVYDVKLIIETTYGCIDSITKSNYIDVSGPFAVFKADKDTICVNEVVTFTLDSIANVFGWEWNFGDGFAQTASYPDTAILHTYTSLPLSGNSFRPSVVLSSQDGLCKPAFIDSIFVYNVQADFTINGTNLDTISVCPDFEAAFADSSAGAVSWAWDFDNGNTGTATTANETYTTGTYQITLTVESNLSAGCVDSKIKTIVVFQKAEVTVSDGGIVCAGDNMQALATGGVSYLWEANDSIGNVSDSLIANPFLTPAVANGGTTFTVTATDINGCTASADIRIDVLETTVPILLFDTLESELSSVKGDTVYVFIGDSVKILIENDDALTYLYNWSPTENIDCSDCSETQFNGTQTTTYNITVTDEKGICPPQVIADTIIVLDEFAFDLPDIFTPNGDNKNDTVFVRGYGIKELLKFEIYNRWGERVYQSQTLKLSEGWDGTFKGRPQPMDTYIGMAVVRRFNGEEPTIKKQITLYR